MKTVIESQVHYFQCKFAPRYVLSESRTSGFKNSKDFRFPASLEVQ